MKKYKVTGMTRTLQMSDKAAAIDEAKRIARESDRWGKVQVLKKRPAVNSKWATIFFCAMDHGRLMANGEVID